MNVITFNIRRLVVPCLVHAAIMIGLSRVKKRLVLGQAELPGGRELGGAGRGRGAPAEERRLAAVQVAV